MSLLINPYATFNLHLILKCLAYAQLVDTVIKDPTKVCYSPHWKI